MKSAKNAGRTIGILLLLQLAAALTVPFIIVALAGHSRAARLFDDCSGECFSDSPGCARLFHRRRFDNYAWHQSITRFWSLQRHSGLDFYFLQFALALCSNSAFIGCPWIDWNSPSVHGRNCDDVLGLQCHRANGDAFTSDTNSCCAVANG
jgi:hypothetical protein